MHIYYLVFLLASCLIFSGCFNKSKVKIIIFTPEKVVVDYTDNDLQEATIIAQQYCVSMNKDAQYVNTEEHGLVAKERHAFFHCVKPVARNQHNNTGSGVR
jgi:hypothetical protein